VRTGSPINQEYLKEQLDLKCQEERCQGCTGGGSSTPDCREKEVVVTEDYEDEASGDGEDIPVCRENPREAVKACKLKEGATELTCTHVETPWCQAPSRNPGQKYRAGRKPLCCETEREAEHNEVPAGSMALVVYQGNPWTDILGKISSDYETEDESPPAVPTCEDGHTYEIDTFKRKRKTVKMCRDTTTGMFAEKLCCDAEANKLLKEKQKADIACARVRKAHCKPDPNVFVGKRSKYRRVPETFACKRMYMCCEKDECVGPVRHQTGCQKEKTGLRKNRPATKTCVAVKLH
jgi:hypothetical protein